MRHHPLPGALLSHFSIVLTLFATSACANPLFEVAPPNLFSSALASQAIGTSPIWGFTPLLTDPRPSVSRDVPALLDRSAGRTIEVGGRADLGYEYRETFRGLATLDDPTIEGRASLEIDSSSLALRIQGLPPGRRRVALTYHFASPFQMKELVAELEGEIQGDENDWIELGLSPNGRDFGHAVRAFARPKGNPFHFTTSGSHRLDAQECWVRIAADLTPASEATLRLFRAACRVKPPYGRQVVLRPGDDGRAVYCETFQSSRVIHLAEIENSSALEWGPGKVFIRGGDGEPVRVRLRQRFSCPDGLRAITVRIRNAANQRECGAVNVFGLSLDGQTLVAREQTPGADGVFQGTTELRLDDPARLGAARQFFLHIELANGASAPHHPSNTISSIEVEARAARP